ncbi:MAG: SpoVG family protein [bacterium]|jgi:DNA-binding cell septation regulator SpoVG|nr:SpoVG family protein [bacterium]
MTTLSDFTIKSITKYESGFALAGVNFQLGPVIVRGAKVFEKDGRYWLGMPGRMSETGEWGDLVYFLDRDIKDAVERAVIEAYQASMAPSESQDLTKQGSKR